jgi:hypothetical protein
VTSTGPAGSCDNAVVFSPRGVLLNGLKNQSDFRQTPTFAGPPFTGRPNFHQRRRSPVG